MYLQWMLLIGNGCSSQRETLKQPTLNHGSYGQRPVIPTTRGHICTDHVAHSPVACLLLFIDASFRKVLSFLNKDPSPKPRAQLEESCLVHVLSL